MARPIKPNPKRALALKERTNRAITMIDKIMARRKITFGPPRPDGITGLNGAYQKAWDEISKIFSGQTPDYAIVERVKILAKDEISDWERIMHHLEIAIKHAGKSNNPIKDLQTSFLESKGERDRIKFWLENLDNLERVAKKYQ